MVNDNLKGFAPISRELHTDPLFTTGKFDKWHAYSDLLFLAQYAEREFEIRGNKVKLLPGQLAKSMDDLAERWSWSKHTVMHYLDELEKSGYIALHKSRIITIVTIKIGLVTALQNAPQTALQNAPQTALPNNKENKERTKKDKENNSLTMREREENSLSFSKPTLEEVENYLRENNIASFAAREFWKYYEGVGWKINKSPINKYP